MLITKKNIILVVITLISIVFIGFFFLNIEDDPVDNNNKITSVSTTQLTSEEEEEIYSEARELIQEFREINPNATEEELIERESILRSVIRQDLIDFKEISDGGSKDLEEIAKEEVNSDPNKELYDKIKLGDASESEYLEYVDIALDYFNEVKDEYENGNLNKETDIVFKFGNNYEYDDIETQIEFHRKFKEIVKECDQNYLDCLEEEYGALPTTE